MKDSEKQNKIFKFALGLITDQDAHCVVNKRKPQTNQTKIKKKKRFCSKFLLFIHLNHISKSTFIRFII